MASPSPDRIDRFLSGVARLTDQEWELVSSRRRNAVATFGQVRLSEIEMVCRGNDSFQELNALLERGYRSVAVSGMHSIAPIAVTDAILGLFTAGEVPWAWTHGLLAPFVPSIIPAGWLKASGVPFTELPTLPECRLPLRIAALTGPEWESCVRIAQYAQAAFGEETLQVTRKKAQEWWMTQPEDQIATARNEALARIPRLVEEAWADTRDLVKLVLKRTGRDEAEQVDSARGYGRDSQAWFNILASDAVFAVMALQVLTVEEFARLYLPLSGAIPFPSLFPD